MAYNTPYSTVQPGGCARFSQCGNVQLFQMNATVTIGGLVDQTGFGAMLLSKLNGTWVLSPLGFAQNPPGMSGCGYGQGCQYATQSFGAGGIQSIAMWWYPLTVAIGPTGGGFTPCTGAAMILRPQRLNGRAANTNAMYYFLGVYPTGGACGTCGLNENILWSSPYLYGDPPACDHSYTYSGGQFFLYSGNPSYTCSFSIS